jgi:FkbM family methyltransferase
MDIGMHTGEDTIRFLEHGYRVVAVEANPELVETAQQVFATPIREGRLTIVSAAIADQRGLMSLGIADNTIWSSLDPKMIARNEHLVDTEYRYVDVETIRFEDVLREHGIPHYLKIDIEGYDMLCVRALRHFDERPRYISVESSVSAFRAPADAIFDEVAELWTLGYRRFRYVDQHRAQNEAPQDDEWIGPAWNSAWGTLARAQALRVGQNLGGFGGRWAMTPVGKAYRKLRQPLFGIHGWFDLQATFGPP